MEDTRQRRNEHCIYLSVTLIDVGGRLGRSEAPDEVTLERLEMRASAVDTIAALIVVCRAVDASP